MKERNYKTILYFISVVILATLCIQVYWNYKNYTISKQQFINDVQTSLDNAVDKYYTSLAHNNAMDFIYSSDSTEHVANKINIQSWNNHSTGSKNDSLDIKKFGFFQQDSPDSIYIKIDDGKTRVLGSPSINSDTTITKHLRSLSSKIVFSIAEDSLSLNTLDSLIQTELKRKNINVDYGLTQLTFFNNKIELRPEIIAISELETSSNSPFFLNKSSLKMYFGDITFTILKRNFIEILLSFILVGSVILCLLYLLKIIKQQKQLAEIKNDLISNITHEFKTPIATIGAAMEGMRTFNKENDVEKNLRYAKISGEQVEKLNIMVEKLLETATLDSDRLSLNFEEVNLVDLLRNASHREVFTVENKSISFETTDTEIIRRIDIFHFENAINNIIDNAIKYGGDDISVQIKRLKDSIEISISDSGNDLSSVHKKQIFEKFYRVSTGNTHNTKGFGIGLYYTKKIIEKHAGTISLFTNGHTTFVISLPNE